MQAATRQRRCAEWEQTYDVSSATEKAAEAYGKMPPCRWSGEWTKIALRLRSCSPKGDFMRSTAPGPAIALRTIPGMLLTLTLAFLPAKTFAQRAAATGAAHAATPPAVVRAPQAAAARAVEAPSARVPGAISRPAGIAPLITRPILIRPSATAPVIQPRSPLLTSGVLPGGVLLGGVVPGLRPRPLPITRPIVLFNPYLASGLYGLGLNGIFPCTFASAIGCGMAPGYYGYGFPAVPQNVYSTDPGYSSPDPGAGGVSATTSAALQYDVLSQYSRLSSLPEPNLNASRGTGGQLDADVLLYFKDGSVFTIASYTVANGRLHYATAYGGEGNIEVVELDVPKTIQANGARGVTFTLTPPSPAGIAATPVPPNPGPAEPGPIYPPKL